MVTTAVRGEGELLSASTQVMLPFPVPEAPDVIVNQGELLAAVHGNVLDEVVTSRDPDPPDAGALAVDGLSVAEPNPPCVNVMADENPRTCRSAELNVEML